MGTNAGHGAPDGDKSRRVYMLLKDAILQGRHPAGSLLPGEIDLAAEFGVSRVTVRRALDALGRDGLIERHPGRGTLVRSTADTQGIAADFATLMPQLVEMERTEARLLSFDYRAAPPAVARALGLAEGARVQCAVRVRSVEGRAFSHLTTHVPEAIARNYSEADLATTPLFRLLERGGIRIDGAEQSVSAALASPEVADALGVPVGAAVLAIERIVRDAEGRGVEHLSALYRPDLFRLHMSLSRVGRGEARHWRPVMGETPREAAE